MMPSYDVVNTRELYALKLGNRENVGQMLALLFVLEGLPVVVEWAPGRRRT